MLKKTNNKLKSLQKRLSAAIHNHGKLVLVVVGVAIVGTVLTILSSADSPSITSTSPNDVVVQYAMPHVSMAVNTTGLATPMTPPFTLYGNGLLVCGHSSSMPFMANMNMTSASTASTPTSRVLTQDEIRTLITKIAGTGYFSLKPEYYQIPVAGQQEALRVNLTSGDHFVFYYRDVPMPAAYKATIDILQSTCSTVTTPYLSSEVAVRAIANADPKGATVSDISKLPATVVPSVQSVVTAANVAKTTVGTTVDTTTGARSLTSSYSSNKSVATTTTTVPVAVKQTVTGATAQNIVKSLNGTQHAFVSQAGKTYEVAADPQLPVVNNPLKVDYVGLRSQSANSGLGNHIKNLLSPHAYAATPPIPMRVVVLLATDGGNANSVAMAQALGQNVQDWYRSKVGMSYDYQGVQVMRGSQTMAYYMTCHDATPCTSSPLLSVLDNVHKRDAGTIYRQDVDTLVVPGWSTNELSSFNACGWGEIGGRLSVVDYTAPSKGSGASLFCFLGAASAHELGHNFGLQHTGDGSLMTGPPLSQYGAYCDIGNSDTTVPLCSLNSDQANTLAATPQFFHPINQLPAAGSASATLKAGQNLYKGQYLLSPGRQCEAVLQSDGNFAIYNSGLQLIFSMFTTGKPTDHLSMQTDGNFVLYSTSGGVLWDGKSHNKLGTHLSMQDDCNLVLYTDANVVVWSSKYGAVGPQNLLPARGLAPTTLNAGQSMYPGNSLMSPALQCQAILQPDGNFVIYGAQLQVYFYTNTAGKPTNRASLQTDGNFVIYANSGGVLWDSTSHNKGGNRLVMQDDCNLVLYNGANTAVWSSKYGPVGPQNLLSSVGSAPSTLYAGQNLYPNQYLLSPAAQCQASLQSDGNFVIYGAQLQVYWYTNTYGQPMNHLSMQTDGNFVFYANSGGRLWDPMLTGRGGTRLVMQDDCNLVLYNNANTAVWSSKTGYLPPNTLWGGENLFMGQYIRSPNGQFRAVLQTDGNFVVYNAANQALFNTHTQGHYDFLAMQGDGNLVVYDISYAVLYTPYTQGRGGQRLVMQDDGNLVLYTAGNVPLWCSFYGRMF